MKKFIPLVISILLFCVPAWAYNMTYLSSAKSHETKSITIAIPPGWSSVEVWGTNDENITCRFVDPLTNNVIYEIANTKLCLTNNASKNELMVYLKVTNNTTKEAQLRAWVHDYKK